MDSVYIAMMAGLLILVASMASVEIGISVALIEVAFGVVGGNLLALHSTPWLDFLASFAGIVLTFLAGAEVDVPLMRARLTESLVIGGVSFLAPFVGTWAFCQYLLAWPVQTAQLAGVALSTTSLAVVYAVLVETGLTAHPTGKLLMAATFVTDFGVAAALSLLFIRPTWWAHLRHHLLALRPPLGDLRSSPVFGSRHGGRFERDRADGDRAALVHTDRAGRD